MSRNKVACFDAIAWSVCLGIMLYWLSVALMSSFSPLLRLGFSLVLSLVHMFTHPTICPRSQTPVALMAVVTSFTAPTRRDHLSGLSLSRSISLINDALSARLPKYNVAREVQRIINLQNWTIWQKCILVNHCKERPKWHWHETVTSPLPHFHHNSSHKTCFLVATRGWVTVYLWKLYINKYF